MAVAPSPTAEATRLTEPWRMSPAAKTPGRLVSSSSGGRSRGQPWGGLPLRSRSRPVSRKPRSSRSTEPANQPVWGSRVEVEIELAQRHRLQPGRAGGGIPVGDEQRPLGRRVQLVRLAQELDPGHAGQPLVGQHQRDLVPVLAELPEGLKTAFRSSGEV